MTDRISQLEPEFVEFMPPTLVPGKLYVSMTYATTQHLCACGCGNKVVLPLSPAEWNLHFDGESVSISPSVGNWEYTCRSHYWIEKNQIRWAGAWSAKQVEAGRKRDQEDVEHYFAARKASTSATADLQERPTGNRILRWVRKVLRLSR